MYPKKLPDFKGYTIDFRLRQFRKVSLEEFKLEFIDFDSKKGINLLTEYYEQSI